MITDRQCRLVSTETRHKTVMTGSRQHPIKNVTIQCWKFIAIESVSHMCSIFISIHQLLALCMCIRFFKTEEKFSRGNYLYAQKSLKSERNESTWTWSF